MIPSKRHSIIPNRINTERRRFFFWGVGKEAEETSGSVSLAMGEVETVVCEKSG